MPGTKSASSGQAGAANRGGVVVGSEEWKGYLDSPLGHFGAKQQRLGRLLFREAKMQQSLNFVKVHNDGAVVWPPHALQTIDGLPGLKVRQPR